jgi:hypothetical protein
MLSSGHARGLYWRRFTVDVLIGAATSAVAFAAIEDPAGNIPYLLLLASALVGIGLLIEPNVTVQSARDVAPQPLPPPTEPKPAPPELQRVGFFDAVIADATSV